MSVPEDAFAAYLRLGTQWPQLRTPLSAAIGCHLLNTQDVLGGLAERPGPLQTSRTATRVEQLHRQFGIHARPVSTGALQEEWRKSVNGLVFLLRATIGEAPHERYDGYFDYTTPEDSAAIHNAVSRERWALDTVWQACRIAAQRMEREHDLARLFRFSFVDERHRGVREIDQYLKERSSTTSAVPSGSSFDIRRRSVRLCIMDEMSLRLQRALGSYPQAVRDGLAFGLDDLARARSQVPKN